MKMRTKFIFSETECSFKSKSRNKMFPLRDPFTPLASSAPHQGLTLS